MSSPDGIPQPEGVVAGCHARCIHYRTKMKRLGPISGKKALVLVCQYHDAGECGPGRGYPNFVAREIK